MNRVTDPPPPPLPAWRVWLLASRPKTLPAAIAPVLVGTALAYRDGAFVLLAAVASLVVALLLQVGANFANDYFDFFKGADTPERVGPVRVVASGLLSPRRLRVGMAVVFGAAGIAGLHLVFRGGLPLLIVGAGVIVAALAYTGGPWPFGYYGLGDVVVFLCFGLIAVAGTYYVQALRLTALSAWSAIPPGLLVTAILVVNNLRDIDTDRRAGKRTLAVLLGATRTRMEYVLLLALAYVVPLLLWARGGQSGWVMLPWLSLPLAAHLVRETLVAGDGPSFNVILARTAQLALLFDLLFALGLMR
ncbi:MAG: 1,4-dihydroxy-2-naphthoate polyprenyltransferase [Chloroflexi bacterium]|nr:1,4-dihydroxy-2-naphthoate polyprenyltransferase [Chloroflexota bacterium]